MKLVAFASLLAIAMGSGQAWAQEDQEPSVIDAICQKHSPGSVECRGRLEKAQAYLGEALWQTYSECVFNATNSAAIDQNCTTEEVAQALSAGIRRDWGVQSYKKIHERLSLHASDTTSSDELREEITLALETYQVRFDGLVAKPFSDEVGSGLTSLVVDMERYEKALMRKRAQPTGVMPQPVLVPQGVDGSGP